MFETTNDRKAENLMLLGSQWHMFNLQKKKFCIFFFLLVLCINTRDGNEYQN
jgi:hypothetical protein